MLSVTGNDVFLCGGNNNNKAQFLVRVAQNVPLCIIAFRLLWNHCIHKKIQTQHPFSFFPHTQPSEIYLILRLLTFKCNISSGPPMILCLRMEITLLWCAHFQRQTVWFHYKQIGLNQEHWEQRWARHHVLSRRQRKNWCWKNISAAGTHGPEGWA